MSKTKIGAYYAAFVAPTMESIYVCDDCARWDWHGSVNVCAGKGVCDACGKTGLHLRYPEPSALHESTT